MCDAGVFAPVLTFQKLFEDEGVPITTEEVRAPMGVHKRVSKLKCLVLFTFTLKEHAFFRNRFKVFVHTMYSFVKALIDP